MISNGELDGNTKFVSKNIYNHLRMPTKCSTRLCLGIIFCTTSGTSEHKSIKAKNVNTSYNKEAKKKKHWCSFDLVKHI
jgi:hypothetical protein